MDTKTSNFKRYKVAIFVMCISIIAVGLLIYSNVIGGKDKPKTALKNEPVISPTLAVAKDTVTPTSILNPTPTLSASSTPGATVKIKVFFSNDPQSTTDPSYGEWRYRTTNRADIENYSIEQIILGPNTTEVSDGLYTPLKLSGTSNCENNADFKIDNNQTSSVATVMLCKSFASKNVGDDKKSAYLISYTLKQFPEFTKVVVLSSDGHCLGDTTGKDRCKL